MFDRTFLPEALFEFVVMADTHYMLDPGERAVEFESRRQQTDRADYVLRQVADLEADFVVHLGDLVQEFPETDGFLQALQEALLQLKDCRVKPYHVAGNHDVGDKPDPTMPTAWVTPESLATHHEHFGRSWYSWDVQDCHFVVLNSQLLNSSLPDAEQQQIWLEEDLQRHQDRRLFLFLHLAPFLCFPQEPSLGHYDNIAPLARDWLLDLIRQYNVELLFSAHSHFAFYNRIDQTQHYGVMSTSFTRPGFSELFSSRPPSEQGRNDVDKLGFYLVRVYEADASIHFIRTGGRVGQAEQHLTDSTLLTNVSADVPTSPLGVTLAHPLAHTTDVPLAWPSMIRQPVRNDYPFLACLELGVQQVRVPITDLADRIQRDRLAMLRDEGCQVTAMWLSDEIDALFEDTQRYNPCFDDLEIQLPGSLYPDQQML
ncbi:MAG: metallophosphoesterase, partial [Chloroflexota bacterium]